MRERGACQTPISVDALGTKDRRAVKREKNKISITQLLADPHGKLRQDTPPPGKKRTNTSRTWARIASAVTAFATVCALVATLFDLSLGFLSGSASRQSAGGVLYMVCQYLWNSVYVRLIAFVMLTGSAVCFVAWVHFSRERAALARPWLQLQKEADKPRSYYNAYLDSLSASARRVWEVKELFYSVTVSYKIKGIEPLSASLVRALSAIWSTSYFGVCAALVASWLIVPRLGSHTYNLVTLSFLQAGIFFLWIPANVLGLFFIYQVQRRLDRWKRTDG